MRVFFVFFLLVFSHELYAQPAKVIYNSAGLVNLKSGKRISKGMVMDYQDPIRFNKGNDTLVLMVLDKGLALRKAELARNGKTSELLATVRSIIWLKNSDKNLYGRPGPINSFEDLGNYFRLIYGKQSVLILDSLEIKLNRNFTKKLPKGFFYLQYRDGKDTINKPLRIDSPGNGTFSFLKLDSSLLYIDGIPARKSLISPVELLYFEEEQEISSPISQFNISYLNGNELKPVICMIDLPAAQWPQAAIDYLEFIYGKADPMQLKANLLKLKCKNQ
ncbi:hypothetical protein [Pedobacter aquatilis]|uniref:hypothetical protein n=1 Tax=Pedobacter aquatilis TaxID=351343 RepID=UPI002930B39F|nr:hypothetical protein [Pedobacter aquatilis]